jgi:hypothetical protein
MVLANRMLWSLIALLFALTLVILIAGTFLGSQTAGS